MNKPIYINGSVLEPVGNEDDIKIITHVCNNRGGWGKGFVLELNKLSPLPKKEYKKWFQYKKYKGIDFDMGNVQFVWINKNTVVANTIAQNGFFSQYNKIPFSYTAFTCALNKIVAYINKQQEHYKRFTFSVHVPYLIGCGYGKGSWNLVERVLQENVCKKGVKLYVYNYKKR